MRERDTKKWSRTTRPKKEQSSTNKKEKWNQQIEERQMRMEQVRGDDEKVETNGGAGGREPVEHEEVPMVSSQHHTHTQMTYTTLIIAGKDIRFEQNSKEI